MTFDDFLVVGTGTLVLFGLFIIAQMVYHYRTEIVSIVSGLSSRARAEGAARRAYRQRVYDSEHMSTQKVSRVLFPNDGNRRSYAVEPSLKPSGSGGAFRVPTIAEQLEQLSEDELLVELARVRDINGNPKYADSRIAKFIGGRVEDRVAQVRDVRGTEPPQKPAAQLRVRDNGVERLIAKYGK